jgi:putative endonuclease
MASARLALGRLGEQLAAEHLQRRGFAIIARGVRTAGGEIDVIAWRSDVLVFAEVKTRRCAARLIAPEEHPLAGLRASQRARLRRAASVWLRETGRPSARTIRFDAIGVLLDGYGGPPCIEHIEGAW